MAATTPRNVTDSALVVEDADSPAQPGDYCIRDDLRMVKPYYFDFKCHVKRRWEGRTAVEVFAAEFPARTLAYYADAMAAGRLRIEGQSARADMPLRSGMCMRHFIHRHEPPVPAGDIQVVGCTPDLVAVDKVAGVPVHAVGQYRKNTVMGILQAARPDLGPLYPTHRLDRPVSGLLLLARSAAAANAVRAQLEGHSLQKVYLARVQGVFPEGNIVADVPLSWDAKANMAAAHPLPPTEPATAAPAQAAADSGANTAVAESGAPPRAAPSAPPPGDSSGAKAALTEFVRLHVSPDGATSLVECRPRTGRTHQIRVHLQHLGHPIANDTQYGGRHGPQLAPRIIAKRNAPEQPGAGGGGASAAKRPKAADGSVSAPDGEAVESSAMGASSSGLASPHNSSVEGGAEAACSNAVPGAAAEGTSGRQPGAGSYQHQLAAPSDVAARFPYKVDDERLDALCAHCPYLVPSGYPIDLQPLWLHCLRYSGAEWDFATSPPAWAAQDFSIS